MNDSGGHCEGHPSGLDFLFFFPFSTQVFHDRADGRIESFIGLVHK
jgi:hypothetical protein